MQEKKRTISRRAMLGAVGGTLTTAACQTQSEAPSLVLLNGRFWPADPTGPRPEAMAIAGDRIAALGSNREIRRLAGLRTKIIDLDGRLALPGFNDAHIHFHGGAVASLGVDLTGAADLAEIQKRVREFAAAHPREAWISGSGWEYTAIPGVLPRREDLDAVVADRPVILRAYDGHTAWVNTRALEMAGVTAASRFEGFGEVVIDPQTGQPTGCLKEGAQSLVRSKMPPVSRARRMQALGDALAANARLGVTSMQNASGSRAEVELYEELLREGKLTTRVYFALGAPSTLDAAALDELKSMAQRYRDPFLRVGAVKLMIDGVIESHTAVMREGYANAPTVRGTPSMPAAELNERVARLDAAGLQIMIHAIGDGGVTMALDAYEFARKRNGGRNARHRIEHIEVLHPGDLPRFAQLEVTASMQPIHAEPDSVRVWSAAVGKNRLPMAFPWQSLEQAGAPLIFGSDWPACLDRDPIRGIHIAVNRTNREGVPAGGWIPDQRIKLSSALRAFTLQPAIAEGEYPHKGDLREGMLADLIVLSNDPGRLPPQAIHQTKVLLTMVGGEVVFREL